MADHSSTDRSKGSGLEVVRLLLAKTFGVPVQESIKGFGRIVNNEKECVTLPRPNNV